MSEELDVNKIVGDFLQANVDRLFKSAAAGAKDVKDQVRVRLERTYRTYLARLIERYARGKSFFVRTEPIPLYDFYVPMDLATQRRVLEKPGAADLGRVSHRSIIFGTGGSGKSMMMRHLLLSALTSRAKTPIFLELRNLNQKELTVRAALLEAVNAAGLEVDDVYFERALVAGHYFVLLDGFDEIEKTARSRVAGEVQKLADQYPNNWVVVSSRHDSTLEGWNDFTAFKLAPLTLDRAIDLVEKVPFDEAVKARFVADMRDRLFAQHESFLSNPLLLSIMLLTYSDVADIPHKLSTFYTQAYEALFNRHDALKSGFRRDRQTGLDIQDFARAFAAFSIFTYEHREFTFPATRALEALAEARDATALPFDTTAYLQDAVQSVCLLVEDGLDITFAHRSFQEYFVARFIHAAPPDIKEDLVKRYAHLADSDNVMGLLFEIDPYVVERYFLLPAFARLREAIGTDRVVRAHHHARYMRTMFSSIEENELPNGTIEYRGAVQDLAINTAVMFAFERYGPNDLFERAGYVKASEAQLREAFTSDYGDADSVPTSDLKVRGAYMSLLRTGGQLWGVAFLERLLAIDAEIRARHATTQDTLSQLLAKRRDARPSPRGTS